LRFYYFLILRGESKGVQRGVHVRCTQCTYCTDCIFARLSDQAKFFNSFAYVVSLWAVMRLPFFHLEGVVPSGRAGSTPAFGTILLIPSLTPPVVNPNNICISNNLVWRRFGIQIKKGLFHLSRNYVRWKKPSNPAPARQTDRAFCCGSAGPHGPGMYCCAACNVKEFLMGCRWKWIPYPASPYGLRRGMYKH